MATLVSYVPHYCPVPTENPEDLPLRAELFSTAQMAGYGRVLADAHEVGPRRRTHEHLLARLADNERVLRAVHYLLVLDVKAERRLTPAAEWLIDNFYVIEEQIRTASQHLPKNYSLELPRLLRGPSADLPRVYDIALGAVSHGDGRLDLDNLISFVTAYQTVTPLKLGELWAIPIMLRLALIENLRRVTARLAARRIDRNNAETWANMMVESATNDPKNLILIVADMARSDPPMVSSFVAELTRRLHGQGPALALPLTWIEQRLSESSQSIEYMVRSENQQQAADQVSMSNSIGSLRSLNATDWKAFVEQMSCVNQTLEDDPADVYSKMDFVTRDQYRHIVEKMARKASCAENDVASAAILLAKEGSLRRGISDRMAHVGYYLVDAGLPELGRVLRMRQTLGLAQTEMKHPASLVVYLGAIVLITLALTVWFGLKVQAEALPTWVMSLAVIPILLCASHVAVAVMNWGATLYSIPHALPRMDYSKGIPREARTLVIVPAMLLNSRNVENLLGDLEVRSQANRDTHLHFGLLTDLCDAPEETMPEDEALVQQAKQGIEALNLKYPRENRDMFFLFHRPRRWNERDQIWMGYERKRGKLSDLNWLLRRELRQEIHPRFALVVGETAILPEVKYVITLDTDTQLARDSARQFVGSMDHPLNRAQYDPQRQRVVAGYGILQPRMGASMGDSSRSLYARMCASEPGIDPYTKAVSDVYQDLFGEGSFIGKGIYEVDTFERVLSGRFPDNRILSHDLIEGCYVRAGLLNDLLLFEEYPASYGSDVIRRHRWIRGDWQIARWMFPRVPSQGTRRISNPLSVLSRWKILDNLRRSLSAAAMTILLLLGWTVFTSAWFWTLAVLGTIFVPILLATVIQLLRKPDDVPPIQHCALSLDAANLHMAQGIFMLSCLPHEMSYSLDAILRTVWRVLFSKKNLLQWNPSGGVPAGQSQLIPTIQSMWCGPILAIATTLGLSNFKPWSLLAASPLLVLWLVSPVIAWWMSRPRGRTSEDLTPSQNLFLRHLSRKTWAFFETFVGANDHWLPPDNFQEYPEPVVAHRTSPTNMGLALLANLAAYDFGYISAAQFLERSTQTLRTMDGLERYRGHFFNWYDTISLKPLTPLYVSSVDSGNLVGHLLTLRQGLLAFPDDPILSPRVLAGLTDTLSVLESALPLTLAPIQRAELRQLLNTDQPEGLQALRLRLELLLATAQELASLVEAEEPDPTSLGQWWMHAFVNQCRDGLTELTEFAPWASRLWPQWQGEADLDRIPSLRELVALGDNIQIMKQSVPGLLDDQSVQAELWPLLTKAADNASHRMTALGLLARQCEALSKIEYLFLYNENLHLLAIGFNVSEHRLDANYYDLLASEARLATFVGIAQGELPQESWFALGRLVTMDGGNPILLSWSGSMFEYLMPLLVMPGFEHTLLDQTCRATVAKQIEYGRKRNVPWGISECGYNAIDVQQNYQYRAFGVPGLGLKRGLATDLVIAPYASALALMIAPKAACSNLMRLSDEGYEAIFGLYEAGDYTPTRLARGQDKTVIRSFMAHHQGMSLLAMAHLLLHRPMQKRFEANPLFQATLLLLQERIPKTSAFYAHTTELSEQYESSAAETQIRIFATPDTINPEVQLLSNGRYHVMLTNAGGGYSTWKDLAVTRWREDRTCDRWGMFCFLCDVTTRDFWSASYQPVCSPTPKYETIFSEGRVEFRTQTRNWDTHSEITVSPEDDIELRRIRITNRSKFRRSLDVTSYAEVVIAPAAADAHHPAFSNLFVQTEILSEQQAILCSRRPRAQSEQQPWMLHMLAVPKTHLGEISYETDRMQFIGRENSITSPQAMAGRADYFSGALSNSQGAVLDPIVAIRCRITLDPEESLVLNYVLGMGETKEDVLGLLEKYQDHRIAERVFDLAWTHGQVLLRQFNASEADAQLYSKLAGSIIHASAGLRADPGLLIRNFRGQSGLWSYGISGDLPIVLLQIQDTANIELVRQLVQAHAYWRLKGLAVDLVIWNEDQAGYRQILHDLIMGLISAGLEANVTDRPGGIFVRSADRIAEEDRILIQTVARVVISDMRGTLEDQINGRTIAETNIPVLSPTRTHRSEPLPEAALPRHDLAFFNGLGGFTPDGREYVITTTPAQNTPAPWANVLANPLFGTVVSECGSAYTWHENAHEFRLTPWNNDPVTDASGEAFYLRDEERGHFWSPTPLPCRGTTPYVTRHGFGYSVFEHTERGIRSELWVYVALDSAIKFSVLKVTNVSARSRRISATGYVEWVLGDLRPKSAPYVVTEIDPHSGALFARNPYSAEFGTRTAFFDVDDAGRTITGDRTEFVGRNKTLSAPAAMSRTRLSGKTGPALDPCAAIQISMTLESGQEREIIFKLGVGTDADDARAVLHRFRGTTAARTALDKVWQHWTHTLGAINVHTPDQGLNILANGWLLYQTLSCRLWARSAIYQSGGAFGFRDQLQDVMALAHARPFLLREHLLLCASRQFEEGDVQHWWHPPVGRGVRTRCSDDYLWLPCATSRYVSITGDTGILNEVVPFLQGRVLNADEESYYDLPEISTVEASLYEHCVKAIRHGLRTGVHGLPLMGSGDWNDGMNLVGENGTGESVWLAFFLYKVLTDFALLARQYGDSLFAEECVREAARLRLNIETTAWDGNWYRRAYFDDGTALGSIENDECQIDSIAQSWAVLSEAADAERSRLAMDAMDARLVHRKQKLIQLFDPPFDVSSLNPGYIKGYVPGVRENGGQYTHAAIWASMAFAHLGDATRAWELFAMITPINHARNAEEIERYKVEPYAMAADVYANPSHCGRGGWTWYTGSAAWMYRLIMESLLGLHLEVDILHITPCIPAEWTEFIVHYRFKETVYHLAFELKRGTEENIVIIEDGIINQESSIRLVDDHAKHWVTVRISRLG